MNSTSSIRVEMKDGLAVVSLSQAERGNPFDGEFTRDFKQVFADLWDTSGLRAVLLRADGANFSVGGDLKKVHPERANLAPLVRRWTGDLHMGLQRAWQLPVPIVAAVQGFAMGGGVALLAGCDVVIAAESARLGSAFAQLGFSCDSGAPFCAVGRSAEEPGSIAGRPGRPGCRRRPTAGVRREKAALFQWVQAPPGNRSSRKYRSRHGGNEMAEAFG